MEQDMKPGDKIYLLSYYPKGMTPPPNAYEVSLDEQHIHILEIIAEGVLETLEEKRYVKDSWDGWVYLDHSIPSGLYTGNGDVELKEEDIPFFKSLESAFDWLEANIVGAVYKLY